MSELQWLREISQEVFNRPYQLEVAQAVAAQKESFDAKAVIEAVQERARVAAEEQPSASAVRKNLIKLLHLRVVDYIENSRGSADIWTRRPGAFWDWIEELQAKVGS